MAALSARTSNSKRTLAYFMCGLFLFLAAILLLIRSVNASHISYDPYADSVATSSALTLEPNNAVGGPNGTNATLAGIGASITLDMGAGEEGTQTLRAYFGPINAQVNVNVEFLNSGKGVITGETRQLGVDLNSSAQNFSYNWTAFGQPYRYVRVSTVVGGDVNLDAIEALGYIGSTPAQDTDGDGRSDRTEQENGTNPLVADPPPGAGNSTAPPGSGGSTGTGGSEQVNPPPPANNDQDGDGIADDYERAHGLNPADKNDANADSDHDGLSNLLEYKINSDTQKIDTDGDGMPDKWEYENGLDVNKNDGDGDPDGDFLSNLGEYRYGRDPHKADDLFEVFAKACKAAKKVSAINWLVIVLLLLGALISWLKAAGIDPFKRKQSRANKPRQ